MKEFWHILVLIATIIGFGVMFWLFLQGLVTLAFIWVPVLIGLLVLLALVFAVLVLLSMMKRKKE